MKEETLKKRGQLKNTVKKSIIIPGLTCLIIAAQTVPMFSSVSNDALARFADSMSYTITAEAATEAPNQDELAEQYGLDTNSMSPDRKYVRTPREGGTGSYYATIEGYEGSAETLSELKSYLGISSFHSKKYPSDGASPACSITISHNISNIASKLSSKSSRKQLAKIGAETTDWIEASWEEAPELTVLHAFGVVNDDFDLIKYNAGNRNKNCTREDFYTMLCRYMTLNLADDDLERIFNDEKASRDLYNKLIGKNNPKRNFIASVANNLNYKFYGRFSCEDVSKKNMAEGITRGEVYSLVANVMKSDSVSLKQKKKKLAAKYSDITMSSFTNDDYGEIKNKEIGDYEAINLYLSMKAGVIKAKNGKLDLQGKITYKEAVQAMVTAARYAGTK